MGKNPKRAAELAAYFTHAKLQVCTDSWAQSITQDRPAALANAHCY